MLGELIPRGGGDPIPLQKTTLLIGRRSSCDIALRFANVSSRHCELELINGYWQVRDLGIHGPQAPRRDLLPQRHMGRGSGRRHMASQVNGLARAREKPGA